MSDRDLQNVHMGVSYPWVYKSQAQYSIAEVMEEFGGGGDCADVAAPVRPYCLS